MDFEKTSPDQEQKQPQNHPLQSSGFDADSGGEGMAPPPFQLQADPGAPVIQRQVLQDGNTGKWYTDLDPDNQDFDLFEEALAYERYLTGNGDQRTSTLYSYTHKKTTNKMSSIGVPQGPHTFGFAAVNQGLNDSNGKQKLLHTLTEQCPTPDTWKQMVLKEAGKDAFDGKTELSKRLIRALNEYQNLYKSASNEIKDTNGNLKFAQEMIKTMINMHPYGTYGWQDLKNASKKALKGKNENRDINDSVNIDNGGTWSNKSGFDEFVEDRKLLVDDDYQPESEEETDDDMLEMDEEFSDEEILDLSGGNLGDDTESINGDINEEDDEMELID